MTSPAAWHVEPLVSGALVDQDEIAPAGARQVVGHAAAGDAASDDDRAGAIAHVLPPGRTSSHARLFAARGGRSRSERVENRATRADSSRGCLPPRRLSGLPSAQRCSAMRGGRPPEPAAAPPSPGSRRRLPGRMHALAERHRAEHVHVRCRRLSATMIAVCRPSGFAGAASNAICVPSGENDGYSAQGTRIASRALAGSPSVIR